MFNTGIMKNSSRERAARRPEGVKWAPKISPSRWQVGRTTQVASLRFASLRRPHGPCDGRAPRSLDTTYLSLNSAYGSELSFITAFMHTIMMTAKMR